MDEKKIDMAPEWIYLIPPNTRFRRCCEHPVNHFYVHFLAGAEFAAALPGVYPIRADQSRLLPICEWAELSRMAKFAALSPVLMAGILALVFDALAGMPRESLSKRINDSRILGALRFLEEHISEPCSNATLARQAAMGGRAFIAAFKASTGETPRQHLIKKRLERAALLLHFSDATIKEIAVMCGFRDRNYLTRLFRRHWGAPPAKFRKG